MSANQNFYRFFISFLFFVFLFVKYHSANRTCRNDQDTYKWKDWCIITCFYGTLSVRCRCKICSRSSHFGFCDAERYLSGIHCSCCFPAASIILLLCKSNFQRIIPTLCQSKRRSIWCGVPDICINDCPALRNITGVSFFMENYYPPAPTAVKEIFVCVV